MEKKPRYSGILMHPVSFYGPHGIGCLGREAREILDRLASAKVNLWQILPLGPTGYGDSPYAARSTFAGNELLIDLRQLPFAKLELIDTLTGPQQPRVDYEKVRRYKMLVLFNAADDFLQKGTSEELAEFEAFSQSNSSWLDDYALYQSLADFHNDSRWFVWPEGEAMREPGTLENCRQVHKDQMARYKVLQYFFFKQWNALHAYANSLGIRIIGDIPIFVAADSVDAWTGRHLFKIDARGRQTSLSGVPPDAFSADGQLWGNPVYQWTEHEKENFAWWKNRIDYTLQTVDIVRIDHFRGFEACWEVPAGSTTAREGKWVKAPGAELFKSLAEDLGKGRKGNSAAVLPVIAEDLGVITPEVEKLRTDFGFPGMKILQFAFDIRNGRLDTSNGYLPHNFDYNCVAYTGTHDNETSRGWFDHQCPEIQDAVRRYLQCPNEEVVWQMMRCLLQSSAEYAVFPMQDLLGLGNEGRMNQPATVGSANWSWRMMPDELKPWMLDRLRDLIIIYGRDDEANASIAAEEKRRAEERMEEAGKKEEPAADDKRNNNQEGNN